MKKRIFENLNIAIKGSQKVNFKIYIFFKFWEVTVSLKMFF